MGRLLWWVGTWYYRARAYTLEVTVVSPLKGLTRAQIKAQAAARRARLEAAKKAKAAKSATGKSIKGKDKKKKATFGKKVTKKKAVS